MELKTINEVLNDFEKNYSFQNLFIDNKKNTEFNNEFIFLALLSLILIILGVLLINIENFRTLGAFSLSIGGLIFLCIRIRENYLMSKHLKSKELPYSKLMVFNWKNHKLKELRIHLIYNDLKILKADKISSYIEIYNSLIKKETKNPFTLFEKYIEYSGKTIITTIIIFLVFEVKTNYTFEKIKSNLFVMFSIFLIVGVLIIFWNLFFKKPYYESHNNRLKKMEDFIFVMKNISFMRLQEK